MTASPISDLNPVFMAARCTLTLAAAGGILLLIAKMHKNNSLSVIKLVFDNKLHVIALRIF